MSHISKRTALILSIVSINAPDAILFGDAKAMEAPQRGGQRTSNNIFDGDVFTNTQTNKKFMFVVTDGYTYSMHRTDNNMMLTIQEVPGTGRCGDYALGIDREELLKKIKMAIKEKNNDVNKYYNNYKVEHGGKYRNMTPDQLFESILEGDTFLDEDMLFLAGKLYKINIELYIPNPNKPGKLLNYKNDQGEQFTEINELILSRGFKHDFPSAPVIRIYHGGYNGYDDFRRTNTAHYRFLYNTENMKPWEKEKVRLLEDAYARYVKYTQDKDRFVSQNPGKTYTAERTYEMPAKEMFRIQAEGLGWAKKTGIIPIQNQGPSLEEQIDSAAALIRKHVVEGANDDELAAKLMQEGIEFDVMIKAIERAKTKFKQMGAPSLDNQIEIAAGSLKNQVEANANIEDMKRHLYYEGFNPIIWDPAIQRAKSMFKPSEKKANRPSNKSIEERLAGTGMTMDEFRQNRDDNKMTDEEFLAILGV